MNSPVCIDANLVVALFVAEEHTPTATELWEKWTQENCQLIAPMLLRYEVTSVFYRKALSGVISHEDALQALHHFLSMDIEWADPPSLPERATELARLYSRPNTYDSHYLALAEYYNCELWTGDERLFNAVKGRFGLIRWIGN